MSLVASYPVGASPDGFAFDGTYIWVTNSLANTVSTLNRATGRVLHTYPTGNFPLSMAYDGKNVWIGNGAPESSSLPPLAAGTLTVLRAYGGAKLGTYASGNGVRGLLYDGTSTWACNSLDNTVTRISTSGQGSVTYSTGAAPRSIAYDGTRWWIANSSSNFLTVITPDSAPVQVTSGVGSLIPPVSITPQPLLPLRSALIAAPNALKAPVSTQALSGIIETVLD